MAMPAAGEHPLRQGCVHCHLQRVCAGENPTGKGIWCLNSPGASASNPPCASQAGEMEPFGASAAGKGDYSRNSTGIETQELPGLLGQHRLPVLVVLGRKSLKRS